MLYRGLGLGLVLLVGSAAHAHFLNGNDLMELVRAWQRVEQRAVAIGDVARDYRDAAAYRTYVVGVHDALEWTEIFCSPDAATQGQLISVVAQYLIAHPERWTRSGAVLVESALKEAFPCEKK